MKAGRDYSWYVSYSWKYELFDNEDSEWIEIDDFDCQRFNCRKRDVKKKVIEYIVKKFIKNIKNKLNFQTLYLII